MTGGPKQWPRTSRTGCSQVWRLRRLSVDREPRKALRTVQWRSEVGDGEDCAPMEGRSEMELRSEVRYPETLRGCGWTRVSDLCSSGDEEGIEIL
ncbi:hypothetical protein KM043_016356 [Ampulex compressa]|nr:hypothetical protein KM043_016356 [Ampulex compressa]